MKRMSEDESRMVEVTLRVVVNVRGNLKPGYAPFKAALHECVQERVALGDPDDIDTWEEV